MGLMHGNCQNYHAMQKNIIYPILNYSLINFLYLLRRTEVLADSYLSIDCF